MASDRPLLYVSFPWPEATPEETSAALAVASEAVSLGWAPISASWMPDLGYGSSRDKSSVVGAIIRSCDAIMFVGKRSKSMNEDHEAFRVHGNAPVYSTKPDSPLGARRLGAPPWNEWGNAAVLVAAEGWKCTTCSHWYGSNERVARWCCVKELPCDSCGALTDKIRIFCRSCSEAKESARHAARRKVPWDGTSLVYSDALDEWFHGLDLAEEHAASNFEDEHGRAPEPAELRIALEGMRLLVGEPVYGRELDPGEWLSDELPDDDCDGSRHVAALQDAAKAFNSAVRGLGVLSYSASDEAIDLDAEVTPALDG